MLANPENDLCITNNGLLMTWINEYDMTWINEYVTRKRREFIRLKNKQAYIYNIQ